MHYCSNFFVRLKTALWTFLLYFVCLTRVFLPVYRNMWFDVEHIKNTFSDASARIEVPHIDAIIDSRLGLEQTTSTPAASPLRRDAVEEWHDVLQGNNVLRKHATTPSQVSLTAADEYLHLPNRRSRFIEVNYSDISFFIKEKPDQLHVPHLTFFLEECSLVKSDLTRANANVYESLEDHRKEDVRGLSFFNLRIEPPILENDQDQPLSLPAYTSDVLSSMPNSSSDCLHVARHWLLEDVKNFTRASLKNDMWHEGSKEMMSRCMPLRRRRELPMDAIFQAECKTIHDCIFPHLRELVASSPRYGTLDDDFEQVSSALEDDNIGLVVVDEKHLLERYDPPRRRPSNVENMEILGKDVSMPGAWEREVDIGFVSREEPSPRVGMQKPGDSLDFRKESACQDYDLFDILMEEDKTGMDNDLDGFLGLMDKEPEPAASKGPAGTLSQIPDAQKDDTSQDSVEDLCLKVPSRILCRPWMLQLAQNCIRERHASIYLPSPLSCLPSLCIVLHTLLNKIDEDYRVLIFCLGNPNLPASIEKYIRHNLSMDYSIDSFLRTTMPKSTAAREASAKSRIFVTDCTEAVEAEACSIMIVLLDCSEDVNGKSHLAKRMELFMENSSPARFANNYMNIVAPYQTSNSCADFHIHAEKLTRMLRIGKSIFCDARFEEIGTCLSLLKHESLILVPSRTASNALRIIDAVAEPLIKSALQSKRKNLKSILPSVLETHVGMAMNRGDSVLQQSLMALHTLRHARSYALYDGAIAALSYLQTADDNTSWDLSDFVKALDKEAEEEEMSERRYHPIIIALRKLLVKEKEKMSIEKRAVTSLWVCKSFSPLIITESEVMFSGILSGIGNVVGYGEAKPGDVSLCLLESLLRADQQQSLKQIAHRHSHIIFIGEDRTGPDALGRLPPAILNVWYAGALRLVQVIIDEYRQMEQRILRGISWYERSQDRVLQLLATTQDTHGFITTTLLCPAVEPLPAAKNDEEVMDLIDGGLAVARKGVELPNRFSPSPNEKLRFSESDVMGFGTDEEMRQAIRKHPAWMHRSREGKVTLEVVVMNLGQNAVVTRIGCAIALDRELQRGIFLSVTLC